MGWESCDPFCVRTLNNQVNVTTGEVIITRSTSAHMSIRSESSSPRPAVLQRCRLGPSVKCNSLIRVAVKEAGSTISDSSPHLSIWLPITTLCSLRRCAQSGWMDGGHGAVIDQISISSLIPVTTYQGSGTGSPSVWHQSVNSVI